MMIFKQKMNILRCKSNQVNEAYMQLTCLLVTGEKGTVDTVLMAAATINFDNFQGPCLLSKLKEVTKGAANNKVRPLIP